MNRISVNGLSHKCSQIVLGTSFFRTEFQNLVFEIVDTYIENGGNVLDTSSVYGFGDSERTIAKWLKTRKNRNEVLLISKACHHFVDEYGVHYPGKKRVNPACITEDLNKSLDRMGVDYFDMFLLHRDVWVMFTGLS